jgi:hypothetical protein
VSFCRATLGWNLSPHFGHSIQSKSTRLTRSGVIVNPHFGQVLCKEARTLSRLSFRERDTSAPKRLLFVVAFFLPYGIQKPYVQ